VPPILPLGLPQPQFAPQFPHAHLPPHPQYSQPPLHPQYAQLPPMMLNPYGQLQVYGGQVNPTHIPNQRVLQAPPGPSQMPVPQPAPVPKNRPNSEVRPGGMSNHISLKNLLTSILMHSVCLSG
jgi:hypothetical protein